MFLLDDERLLSLSYGQVKSIAKFNFRKREPSPIAGGLFAAEIFGPTEDYTCLCGIRKYPRKAKTPKKCKVCGVDYVSSSERDRRFGHIDLRAHYVNPLFIPSLANICGLSEKSLTRVLLGYEKVNFICVTSSRGGKFKAVNGKEYNLILDKDSCYSSAEGLLKLFNDYDIDPVKTLELTKANISKEYLKQGYTLFSFFNQILLITPAGMRPPKRLNDRVIYDTSNLIYSRLIREANKLLVLEKSNVEIEQLNFIKSQISMVYQKIINMMVLKGGNFSKVKIKPKIENISGKLGLVRGNILGKTVDFSGRSIICSAPDQDINTVGIPYEMLQELYKPHLIHDIAKELKEKESVYASLALRMAVKRVKTLDSDLMKRIDKLAETNPILLNRAPSLHMYSLLGFKVKPTSGKVIKLPPSACTPFNADFDGDQMAVHLPISEEAKKETENILMFKNNLKSSATFEKINSSAGHEQVVGAFLLTRAITQKDQPHKFIGSINEIISRLDSKKLTYDDIVITKDHQGQTLKINAGSIVLYNATNVLPYLVLNKKGILEYYNRITEDYSKELAHKYITVCQKLFFKVATNFGLSISIDDLLKSDFQKGLINEAKQVSKTLEGMEKAKVWDEAINHAVEDWKMTSDKNNSLIIMAQSGARVTDSQIRQMIIAKGLLTNMTGELEVDAVPQSLSDGLTPINYFQTCAPARKGLSDNHFLVPASGYLERQLVNLTRDLNITAEDCRTSEGLLIKASRARGKYLNESYGDYHKGELITKYMIKDLPEMVNVRSPVKCEHNNGLCAKCCGINPSNLKPWRLGYGIGVASATTLVEPITQLGLRGKHTSGSVVLKDYGHQVNNAIADLINSMGALSTSSIKLEDSKVNSPEKIEGANYDEKAINLVKQIQDIYENNGVDIYTTYIEVIARALSDVILPSSSKEHSKLRSQGFKTDSPVFMNIKRSITKNPSLFKRLCFGYVKTSLIDSIFKGDVLINTPTEKLMSGRLIHEFN